MSTETKLFCAWAVVFCGGLIGAVLAEEIERLRRDRRPLLLLVALALPSIAAADAALAGADVGPALVGWLAVPQIAVAVALLPGTARSAPRHLGVAAVGVVVAFWAILALVGSSPALPAGSGASMVIGAGAVVLVAVSAGLLEPGGRHCRGRGDARRRAKDGSRRATGTIPIRVVGHRPPARV